MTKSDKSYEVGYAKPPQSTRFQTGRSGNPKGRPRGSKNLATVLDHELRQRVIINENGRRKTITKLEAITKQTVNKAATGDTRSQALLFRLLSTSEDSYATAKVPHVALSDNDEKLKNSILQRIKLTLPPQNVSLSQLL